MKNLKTYLQKLTYSRYSYLAICLLLLLVLAKCQHTLTQTQTQLQNALAKDPDTVYIDKPYKVIEIKEVEVYKPYRVEVYPKDTTYRKALERDTLITAVSLTPDKAHVHTITPNGSPRIASYDLPSYQELTFSTKGKLKINAKKDKRKKNWHKAQKVFFFLAGIFIGVQSMK